MQGLRERIALQVGAYLEPASHAAWLAQSMLGRGGATNRTPDACNFARSVLNEAPLAANVLFADGAGNLMLVRRAVGVAGATETKRILTGPTGRTVEWSPATKSGR
jgi:prepilin-type processing-associated H-X9-DG protein